MSMSVSNQGLFTPSGDAAWSESIASPSGCETCSDIITTNGVLGDTSTEEALFEEAQGICRNNPQAHPVCSYITKPKEPETNWLKKTISHVAHFLGYGEKPVAPSPSVALDYVQNEFEMAQSFMQSPSLRLTNPLLARNKEPTLKQRYFAERPAQSLSDTRALLNPGQQKNLVTLGLETVDRWISPGSSSRGKISSGKIIVQLDIHDDGGSKESAIAATQCFPGALIAMEALTPSDIGTTEQRIETALSDVRFQLDAYAKAWRQVLQANPDQSLDPSSVECAAISYAGEWAEFQNEVNAQKKQALEARWSDAEALDKHENYLLHLKRLAQEIVHHVQPDWDTVRGWIQTDLELSQELTDNSQASAVTTELIPHYWGSARHFVGLHPVNTEPLRSNSRLNGAYLGEVEDDHRIYDQLSGLLTLLDAKQSDLAYYVVGARHRHRILTWLAYHAEQGRDMPDVEFVFAKNPPRLCEPDPIPTS